VSTKGDIQSVASMKREGYERKRGDAPETEGIIARIQRGVSSSTRGVLEVSVQWRGESFMQKKRVEKKEQINIRTDERGEQAGENPSMAQTNGRAGKASAATQKKKGKKGDK